MESQYSHMSQFIIMLHNQSALSDMKPWNTDETIIPLNAIQPHLRTLTNIKSQSLTRSKSPPTHQMYKNRRTFTSQSATRNIRNPRYLQQTSKWFPQHALTPPKEKARSMSRSRMSKPAEEFMHQSPIKITQLSTQIAREDCKQGAQNQPSADCTPMNGLCQFTNTALKSIKNKQPHKKLSYMQFCEGKAKEKGYFKYPNKLAGKYYPKHNTAIHVKYNTEECISLFQPTQQLLGVQSSLNQFRPKDGRGRRYRRRLVSSYNCCKIGGTSSPNIDSPSAIENFRQFRLVPPS